MTCVRLYAKTGKSECQRVKINSRRLKERKMAKESLKLKPGSLNITDNRHTARGRENLRALALRCVKIIHSGNLYLFYALSYDPPRTYT